MGDRCIYRPIYRVGQNKLERSFLDCNFYNFYTMSIYVAHGIIWLFGACGTNFR